MLRPFMLLALAAPAAGQAPTSQAIYAAAQAAYDAGRWPEAEAGFAQVLPRLKAGPQQAVVRARMGGAMLRQGRPDDAALAITAALPLLPDDERQAAMAQLGEAREALADYAGARAAFTDALALGGAPLTLRIAKARAGVFVDPAAAKAEFDALLPEAEAAFRGQPETLALVQALRGRATLMTGDAKGARRLFDEAVKTAGGLSTNRVTVVDARIRGDLSTAAWLAGDRDTARTYLAYTGANMLADKGFTVGADMSLPACARGLLPDDAAVVEIAIAPDGRVASSQTIWANRLGGPESRFAQAARGWSWPPEVAAKMPLWWRAAVRLEMRCADDRAGPLPMAAVGDMDGWLASKGVPAWTIQGPDAATLGATRAELARRDGLAAIPALLAIAENSVAPPAERRVALERARDLAEANSVPPDLVAALRVRAAMSGDPDGQSRAAWRETMQEQRARVAAVAERLRGEGRADTKGYAYARLAEGTLAGSLGDGAAARAAFEAIAAMPTAVLPPANGMRQVALLQLANLAAREGRAQDAARLYASTGLQPGQCSLLDAPPRVLSSNEGSGKYPFELMMNRFEGFVRLSYDITPDGRADNVRAVTASPPFVFSDASVRVARALRYEPVFRPDGGKGCSAASQFVRFSVQR